METVILLTVSLQPPHVDMFCNCLLKKYVSVQFLGIILINHVRNFVLLDVINKYEIVYLPYFHLLCIT
jgi:hypothetical protein